MHQSARLLASRPDPRLFVAMSAGGFALVLLPGGPPVAWGQYAVAVAVLLAAFGVYQAGARVQRYAAVPTSLTFLVAVGLLRHSMGGSSAGVVLLVFLPLVWTALYGVRRDLVVVVTGIMAVQAVPLIAIGAPMYPSTGWRVAILTVALAAIIGHAVQQLVGALRDAATRVQTRDAERDVLLGTLEALAATDSLTGIANRRAWEHGLETALGQASEREAIAIALIDIDHFKAINDAGGHGAGDVALRRCTQAWLGQLRPTDLLARLGGDEFGLLLRACNAAGAQALTERLRSVTPAGITISAGVVERRPGESARELATRADRMLYAAKSAGRDVVVADAAWARA